MSNSASSRVISLLMGRYLLSTVSFSWSPIILSVDIASARLVFLSSIGYGPILFTVWIVRYDNKVLEAQHCGNLRRRKLFDQLWIKESNRKDDISYRPSHTPVIKKLSALHDTSASVNCKNLMSFSLF
jgi:hypothetical protein